MGANIWKQYPKTLYYSIRHPLKTIGDFVRSVKWAWQRSVRGYADTDWWNMCDWMTEVLSDMLDTCAEKHFGFPAGDDGFTDEEWTAYLREIATHLRNSSEAQCEQVNEYDALFDAIVDEQHSHMERREDANGFIHHIYPEMTAEQKSIRDKYFQREMEISKWREAEAQKAFEMIGKHFFAFWD